MSDNQYPDIAGRCPACGRSTLFRGLGGHITCGWIGQPSCPNPTAVDDALHGVYRLVPIDRDGAQ